MSSFATLISRPAVLVVSPIVAYCGRSTFPRLVADELAGMNTDAHAHLGEVFVAILLVQTAQHFVHLTRIADCRRGIRIDLVLTLPRNW
jgi:hypothetical protein